MPQFSFSRIGQKLTGRSGILELMDDLGRALTTQPQMRMLGGGNPAAVPEIQALWRRRMSELLAEGAAFDGMLGNYDPPQGNPRFLAALAKLLRERMGWQIGPENLAITTGGQTAFFYLFNLLAGTFDEPQAASRSKRILLPLCPEYIGYADQGLSENLFVACRPQIEWPHGEASRVFKYRIDFTAVKQALAVGDIAAIAVSRPTNPTGNVLTDDEVRQLSELAEAHQIPLIVDNAYGAPFPGVIFVEAQPLWAPHMILTLSLSKLGLPGTRTAIVIAPPEIASAMGAMTAITGLANGNIGQQLVLPLVEDGTILDLGPKILRPFYQERSYAATAWAVDAFDSSSVDWAMHASEGAFFHWIWLRNLSIPTRELYEKLKARNVLIVPGEYFFFGLKDDWPHSRECLRLNFSRPESVVREGLAIIAEEAARYQR